MPMFRRKVTYVEAVQYTGKGPDPVGVERCHCQDRTCDYCGGAFVTTAHKQRVLLTPGDWVLPEPQKRGYYPVKDDIFRTTWEPLEDPE